MILVLRCGGGKRPSAEIDHRLRPLEQAGEKQVILDTWVLRELLNQLSPMAAERPTRLTKEDGDGLFDRAQVLALSADDEAPASQICGSSLGE